MLGQISFRGSGTPSNPQSGDQYVNPDGSINATYVIDHWQSGGMPSNPQPYSIAVGQSRTSNMYAGATPNAPVAPVEVQPTPAAVQGSAGGSVNSQQGSAPQATTQTTNVTNPPNVFGFSVPDFPSLDFLGIKWYLWAAGAVAAYLVMQSGEGSYHHRGRV